eukprot:g10028.t1
MAPPRLFCLGLEQEGVPGAASSVRRMRVGLFKGPHHPDRDPPDFEVTLPIELFVPYKVPIFDGSKEAAVTAKWFRKSPVVLKPDSGGTADTATPKPGDRVRITNVSDVKLGKYNNQVGIIKSAPGNKNRGKFNIQIAKAGGLGAKGGEDDKSDFGENVQFPITNIVKMPAMNFQSVATSGVAVQPRDVCFPDADEFEAEATDGATELRAFREDVNGPRYIGIAFKSRTPGSSGSLDQINDKLGDNLPPSVVAGGATSDSSSSASELESASLEAREDDKGRGFITVKKRDASGTTRAPGTPPPMLTRDEVDRLLAHLFKRDDYVPFTLLGAKQKDLAAGSNGAIQVMRSKEGLNKVLRKLDLISSLEVQNRGDGVYGFFDEYLNSPKAEDADRIAEELKAYDRADASSEDEDAAAAWPQKVILIDGRGAVRQDANDRAIIVTVDTKGGNEIKRRVSDWHFFRPRYSAELAMKRKRMSRMEKESSMFIASLQPDTRPEDLESEFLEGVPFYTQKRVSAALEVDMPDVHRISGDIVWAEEDDENKGWVKLNTVRGVRYLPRSILQPLLHDPSDTGKDGRKKTLAEKLEEEEEQRAQAKMGPMRGMLDARPLNYKVRMDYSLKDLGADLQSMLPKLAQRQRQHLDKVMEKGPDFKEIAEFVKSRARRLELLLKKYKKHYAKDAADAMTLALSEFSCEERNKRIRDEVTRFWDYSQGTVFGQVVDGKSLDPPSADAVSADKTGKEETQKVGDGTPPVMVKQGGQAIEQSAVQNVPGPLSQPGDASTTQGASEELPASATPTSAPGSSFEEKTTMEAGGGGRNHHRGRGHRRRRRIEMEEDRTGLLEDKAIAASAKALLGKNGVIVGGGVATGEDTVPDEGRPEFDPMFSSPIEDEEYEKRFGRLSSERSEYEQEDEDSAAAAKSRKPGAGTSYVDMVASQIADANKAEAEQSSGRFRSGRHRPGSSLIDDSDLGGGEHRHHLSEEEILHSPFFNADGADLSVDGEVKTSSFLQERVGQEPLRSSQAEVGEERDDPHERLANILMNDDEYAALRDVLLGGTTVDAPNYPSPATDFFGGIREKKQKVMSFGVSSHHDAEVRQSGKRRDRGRDREGADLISTASPSEQRSSGPSSMLQVDGASSATTTPHTHSLAGGLALDVDAMAGTSVQDIFEHEDEAMSTVEGALPQRAATTTAPTRPYVDAASSPAGLRGDSAYAASSFLDLQHEHGREARGFWSKFDSLERRETFDKLAGWKKDDRLMDLYDKWGSFCVENYPEKAFNVDEKMRQCLFIPPLSFRRIPQCVSSTISDAEIFQLDKVWNFRLRTDKQTYSQERALDDLTLQYLLMRRDLDTFQKDLPASSTAFTSEFGWGKVFHDKISKSYAALRDMGQKDTDGENFRKQPAPLVKNVFSMLQTDQPGKIMSQDTYLWQQGKFLVENTDMEWNKYICRQRPLMPPADFKKFYGYMKDQITAQRQKLSSKNPFLSSADITRKLKGGKMPPDDYEKLNCPRLVRVEVLGNFVTPDQPITNSFEMYAYDHTPMKRLQSWVLEEFVHRNPFLTKQLANDYTFRMYKSDPLVAKGNNILPGDEEIVDAQVLTEEDIVKDYLHPEDNKNARGGKLALGGTKASIKDLASGRIGDRQLSQQLADSGPAIERSGQVADERHIEDLGETVLELELGPHSVVTLKATPKVLSGDVGLWIGPNGEQLRPGAKLIFPDVEEDSECHCKGREMELVDIEEDVFRARDQL